MHQEPLLHHLGATSAEPVCPGSDLLPRECHASPLRTHLGTPIVRTILCHIRRQYGEMLLPFSPNISPHP